MAVDGLNTRGAYPIYDTSGSTGYFLKNVQKQADKRAAEQKLLYDDLSKPKMDGIREGDRAEYIQKYNDMRGIYSQIDAERDPNRKAQLTLDFRKSAMGMDELIADSKGLAKGVSVVSTMFLDPNKRRMYADDAVTRFQKSNTLSRNDPNFVRDLTTLELKLDTAKVNDEFRKTDTYLKSNAKWQDPVSVSARLNGVNGSYTSQTRVVNPSVQAQEYLTQAKNNPNTELFFKNQYPNLPIEQAVVEFAKGRDLSEQGKSTFSSPNETRRNMLYSHNLAMIRKNSGGDKEPTLADIQYLEREKTINGMMNGEDGAIDGISAILAGQSGYNQKGLTVTRNGSAITFKVPSKTIETEGDSPSDLKTKTTPSYKITVDTKNPYDRVKLGRLLDDITGIKVTGKPHKVATPITTTKQASTVTMVMPNGSTGEIPANKVGEFMKKYPKAKRQ